MSDEYHLPLQFCLILFTLVLFVQSTEAAKFKTGKINVTTADPGLFACQKVSFAQPFGGREVKVFASFGHSVKNPSRGYGAAIWVESEDTSQFTTCISEYGGGSNGTAEVNWIAVLSVPSGAQVGTTALKSWTTGTECKKIDFPQRFLSAPTIFATPSHQSPGKPQDAMAVWINHQSEESFTLCLRETRIFDGLHQNIKINWLAFTSLSLENFALTDSLVFAKNNSLSQKESVAFCKKINFTEAFFSPPVAVVTPKRIYNNKSSGQSAGSGCDAITAWVEHTSTNEMEICVKNYDSTSKDTIKVDYLVIGDLDPCLDVTCDYHCLCKAFGPHDARCVSVDSCPSFQEPICSSNGTTYDNNCLFEQQMCLLQLNFTVQHPGSCEGFPFQRGRRHMPHIPSLGYSHCEVIRFQPYVFYPDKPIEVQITVNHIGTFDKSYVHDAIVSWVEKVNYHQFTACVMAAGFNERQSKANVTVDWMGYQGAPVGGISGETRVSQWWTGTTCETVHFPSGTFSKKPSVFITAAHHHAGLKRDAASIWLEDITRSSLKICLRELQNYAGSHEDIYVKWLVFSSLHKPLFSELNSVYFANSQHPPADYNDAFCKDIHFAKVYKNAPSVFVSANHSFTGGNRDPMHNSITSWVEYINTTGARICLKELYESKYDPLSVSYTVLSDICKPGWSYFGGFCYFTSSACASWLTAESNCSAMSSNLVTIHNQEENVYIQHRNNGERSWIGLNDRSVEGSFVWPNKEVSSFRFWAPRQPNNWREEDCVHTLGVKHGYTWNDVSCDNCYNFTCFTDIDECSTKSHSCHVNATCSNMQGSYKCACKAGYSGDGEKCTDIDECSTNSHSCHANATCSNMQGSYTCACKAGYSGDGKTCIGIAFKAVFTNLGASGRLGPTSLGSHYSGQDHDGQVSLVSGIQRWTVPYTGDYKIEAVGASGGYDTYTNSRQRRGRGARMIGTFRLSKGETIQILVGQEGGINIHSQSSGGGGGTFVVRASNTPMIIAGGGGGIEYAYSRHTECDASTATSGRAGYRSWSGGSSGHGAKTADSSNSGGGGGGFYSSGRSSTQFGGSMGNGGEGGKGFLQGGVGGRAKHYNAVGGFGGGGGAYGAGGGAGGGGGYSGGSSGENKHDSCGGGGGSYNAGKNQQNECCYNTAGHGQVIMTLI